MLHEHLEIPANRSLQTPQTFGGEPEVIGRRFAGLFQAVQRVVRGRIIPERLEAERQAGSGVGHGALQTTLPSWARSSSRGAPALSMFNETRFFLSLSNRPKAADPSGVTTVKAPRVPSLRETSIVVSPFDLTPRTMPLLASFALRPRL